MKTKLLRKIHKRYNWYFNKDKFPVLIDHKTKRVTLYDLEYMCERFNYKLKDLPEFIKTPYHSWALNAMKLDILTNYGWTVRRTRYRIAVRRYKSKIK